PSTRTPLVLEPDGSGTAAVADELAAADGVATGSRVGRTVAGMHAEATRVVATSAATATARPNLTRARGA
ncbi:MAG TPA: hypothetical protein VF044_01555, partial [Actinomycetota bacterium]